MFGLFRKQSPLERLKADYAKLLEEAMLLQRNGDLRAASAKTSESEAVLREIEAIERDKAE